MAKRKDVEPLSGIYLDAGRDPDPTRRPQMATTAPKKARPKRARNSGGMSIDKVINRAIEVIGDKEQALTWLGTSVPALNYATPISLLANPQGQAAVLAVLTRLEQGVL
jgi:uncharacterized protein (DUF2384 family)